MKQITISLKLLVHKLSNGKDPVSNANSPLMGCMENKHYGGNKPTTTNPNANSQFIGKVQTTIPRGPTKRSTTIQTR